MTQYGLVTRRDLLTSAGAGFGGLALAHLLAQDGIAVAPEAGLPPAKDRNGLHHPAKVRRIIQLFMNGGVSQMDTFDYKPELIKRHGEKVDFGLKAVATSVPGNIMKPPFEFQQHGECGR